jgi:hypothetical protein
MRDCVFIGTPNGLLKIAIPSGECILYAEREHINGIEKKLRNSLNWTHVITGSLQIKGRTLYCGYFNQPGGIASFIISRDKHSGEMSYMPVPIAGLHRMVLLDKHRIALAGCALKKYGEEEYAYFGGMAIYNVRTASITVVNDDPVSNISLSSGTMVVERILGAGVDMALMEREVIKYSASTMEELSRDYEEAGLDEPEKYDALKKIHDAVLAGRTDIPEAKHSAIVARRLAQKAIVTTEQIPARIVPITDKVRQKIENGN